DTVTVTVSAPVPLSVSITSPSMDQSFKKGDNILFSSSVSGGVPPYTYLWEYFDTTDPSTIISFGNSDSFQKNDFPAGEYEIFLTVTDSAGTSASYPEDPHLPHAHGIQIIICESPFAAISLPMDGSVFEELDSIHFEGSFRGCWPLTFEWTSNIDGFLSNKWSFDTKELSVGTHTITFYVRDPLGQSSTSSITVTVNPSSSVRAIITSPKNEEVWDEDDTVTFDALVAGGTPPYTYTWTSSIDGLLSNSKTFTKTGLSQGDHTITFTVTDSSGSSQSDSVTIHVPPEYFDWRDYKGQNWLTPVRLQLCGDCWAFATVGVIEAKYNIQENNPNLDIDLSEQYLVSDCCDAGSCSGGYVAFSCTENTGVAEEICIKYTGTNTGCPNMCDDAPIPIDLWKTSGEITVNGGKNIRHALVKNGPMYVAIDATPLSASDRKDRNGCTIYTCGGDHTDHGVVLVGYDDDNRYWIVKNSWGVLSGCSGYYSLDYNTCNINQATYIESVTPP
ncbi:MAG: hypothetical protein DRP11_03855, partial [Candidatus Aenigmatarchaeota archaeon]